MINNIFKKSLISVLAITLAAVFIAANLPVYAASHKTRVQSTSNSKLAISSVLVAPCTSTSCSGITTVIVNGSGFNSNMKVAAIGTLDGKYYKSLYAVIANITSTMIIVDFHSLPCNQLYKVYVYNPKNSKQSATQKDSFTPSNYCG